MGQIGYYLCELLLQNNYNVKIIEKTKALWGIKRLFPRAVIIHADGTDQDVLNQEGLKEADAIVALANIDEENIVVYVCSETRC